MKCTILRVFALVSVLHLHAEPINLTLEDAIQLAIANSPALQDQEIMVSAALRNKENVWNLFLPGISADVTGRFSDAVLFPPDTFGPSQPFTSSVNMDIRLSLDTKTLYDLGKRHDDYATALVAAQEARREFIVEVEKAYFSLVASSMDVENSLRTLELEEESYRQTRIKFDRGLESELTLLNAELELQGSQTALVSAEAGYGKKATAFKRLLGLDPQTSLVLTSSLTIRELDSGSLESLMGAIGQRLDLELKRRAIQAASVAADRYHASTRLPLLTLGSSVSLSLDDFSVPADGFSVSAGVSLNADAWIPGSQKDLAYIALLEARDHQALEYDRMLKAAREKVEDLIVDLSLRINDLRLTEARLALAERIHIQTKAAYEGGTATLLSLNDALNKVELQRQALVSSQLAYLLLVIDAGYALGVEWQSLPGVTGN
ncbi:MAG: TolC family protein [Clostridia bacterium]|jgi:multidrug efflux system outer membrane protein